MEEGGHATIAALERRTYFSAEARDVWTGITLAPLAATGRRIQ
jgi:hypothetical protein